MITYTSYCRVVMMQALGVMVRAINVAESDVLTNQYLTPLLI